MTLIKHQQTVVKFRQGLHADRGQHQVVVGHNHLRLGQAAARLVVTAVPVARAMAGGTGVALGGHGRPVMRFGLIGQIIPIAIPLAIGQGGSQHGVQGVSSRLRVIASELAPIRSGWRRGVVVWAEQVVLGAVGRATVQAVKLELANVAATALGQCEHKWGLEYSRQGRQVLAHQLLLQGHRGGGDDHPGLQRQRQRYHGRPVGS